MEKKIIFDFLSIKQHPATHECPQKNSAQSVQPFGRLYATYILYMNVLFYYIDELNGPALTVEKSQPNRSSRLAGSGNIYMYDCLVLLYRRAEGPGVARG